MNIQSTLNSYKRLLKNKNYFIMKCTHRSFMFKNYILNNDKKFKTFWRHPIAIISW